MDQQTGTMLNPNMEFYKLAGLGDIGELVVHMMTGKGYDERGPIGLGEPPTVSPGAVISNAVANAIGVRVPTLPLTPESGAGRSGTERRQQCEHLNTPVRQTWIRPLRLLGNSWDDAAPLGGRHRFAVA